MHKFTIYSFFAFLLLFSFFINTARAQQNRVWTLEECIEHAWENNLHLQQQKLTLGIARENLSQSRANLFPSLNASASHAYNFGRRVDPFTNEFSTESIQSNNFSLSTAVNIFNGFQLQNAIKQNAIELEATRFDLDKTYNDIALMVASAYLQVLFAGELVENAVNQLEISRLQVERTARLVEAGTLPRGALLTIQAQMATEELQLVNAQNQLDLSYLNLSQLLFLPPEEEFVIASPDIDLEPEEEPGQSPMQVFQTAAQQQPEVKSAELRIVSAERGLDIARGGRYPMLSLRGALGTGYSEASIEPVGSTVVGVEPIAVTASGEDVFVPVFAYDTRIKPFRNQVEDNFNQSVGLYLTIPIFNNYQTRSAISRSRINLDNARLQNQIVREQLFQTIQQAHADATAALKRYTATDKNVEALEESFRYSEQRFNVGMMNSVEYNDAKNRLAAAQSEMLQAKYEYLFRMKILDFYMGNPLSL